MARLDDLRNEYREVGYFVRLIITFRLGILPLLAGFLSWTISILPEIPGAADGISLALVGLIGVRLLRMLESVYKPFVAKLSCFELIQGRQEKRHEAQQRCGEMPFYAA